VTKDLRAVSRDRHLAVEYLPYDRPRQQVANTTAHLEDERMLRRKAMERDNCGFRNLEILPNNLGYLKLDRFADPMFCGETAVAAMTFLSHVDAIIFDLRENHGGDPKMVALIISYLFENPTHLNDLYNRKQNITTQYWTLPYLPSERLANKKAFVLTSKSTFSAAEEFSYDLKSLKRAILIGETTQGGSHPVDSHEIRQFVVQIPGTRVVNPITKTDWEGRGVEPDRPIIASKALEEAQILASEQNR
jgi:C-terminal processing protease CtpA/Prc